MTQSAPRPPQRYSLATAICLIMGICIGSGIFFKTDNVLVSTGGDIGLGVVMFCLAATYIVFGGLCLSLFAARTAGAGGLVDYAEKFVSPRFARMIGLHYAFVYLPSISAVIFWVVGVYACMLLGLEGTLAQQAAIGLAAMLLCSAWNAVAPRLSGWLQNASTIVKVAPLVAVGAVGVVRALSGTAVTDAPPAPGAGAGPAGLAWLAAAAPIAFAFDGWPAATSVAPELRDARRNLPIALVAAPLAILALYLAYFVGLSVSLGPAEVMASGDASLSVLFVRLFGERAAAWPSLVALLAVLGTGNGLMLTLHRLPVALALQGAIPRAGWLVRTTGGPARVALGSAAVATAFTAGWLALHVGAQAYGLIPNGDVSEVSVCLTMLLMVPYFVAAWRLGGAGALRGRVAPVLATACCLVVGISGLAEGARLAFAAVELIALLGTCALLRRGDAQAGGVSG